MELDAPALVRGILSEHGLTDGIADRVLLAGVDTDLATEHADGIGALSDRTIVPALDRREAEADWLSRRRMLPRALGQRRNRGLQLALRRRRSQQLSDDGKAQPCPSVVNTGLVGHAGAPVDRKQKRGRPVTD